MSRVMMVVVAIMSSWARAMAPCSPDYCAAFRCATSKAECTARHQGYRTNLNGCGYCGASVDINENDPGGSVAVLMTDGDVLMHRPAPLHKMENCKRFFWT